MKILSCSSCKKEKDESLFPKANGKARGYAWVCKQCKKEIRVAKHLSMTKEAVKAQNKNYWLKTSYGISLDEFNVMLKNQQHKCAICECDETEAYSQKLYVDHCHVTKKIRGLLCHSCNVAIGNFKDSTENLKKAIAYLETNK
jgi:hypothetical protein